MSPKIKNIIEPLTLSDTPLSYRLSALSKRYYGAVSKHFENLDLERNFFILNIISKHDHITQQALANMINVDKTRIVHVIDYLSGKGLVRREVSPDDRREHRIVATKKAIKYVEKISNGFNELNKKAFKGFSKTEIKEFLSMLERIQRNISLLPSEDISLKYIKRKRKNE